MLYSKSNAQILAELDKLVYGHTEAKKALINLVNRSRVRYHQLNHFLDPIKEEDLVSNINCLLIGASGTGKTHLVQSLSKVCDFPLLCIDANKLAPTSTTDGLNEERLVRSIAKLSSHLVKTKPDRYFSLEGTMQQVVVFVDEIDKLATNFESSGNWNKHVQANFLKLFENSAELKHISFIFAGAFSGMKVRPADSKQAIGFNNNKTEVADNFDVEEQVIKYGLIPELVGRIHNIVVLDKLEESDFKNILTNMVLPKTKKELVNLRIDNFELTADQIDEISKRASKSELGVRVLQKEVHKISQELEFNYDSYKDNQKVLK